MGKKKKTKKCDPIIKYEDILFDMRIVHDIDIRISEKDWADLLKDPFISTKYHVDITINGETLEDVAISTKGFSSLAIPASSQGNQRYSFKILFGKYRNKQTYHGLDKMDLNCCFCDPTLMKDYFSYRLFRLAHVPTPLCGHAWVTINGRDHGLYLILEKPEDSFLKRNFGKGAIYKPEVCGMKLAPEKMKQVLQGDYSVYDTPLIPRGSDFVYIDDDPASYPDIFEKRKTKGHLEEDFGVIASLETLSRGTHLKEGLDTHEIIRYFAVHNFLLNFDSYTGSDLHNMLICEKDGIMSMLPWDYNLSFGTYVTHLGKEVLKDVTDLLNLGIDTPLIGTDEGSRPLWAWIIQNEKYRLEYHDVLSDLVTLYFGSGLFERELNNLREMLAPYMEKDPNAFYSKEEFEKGVETLRQFCLRRAESISRQLSKKLSADSTRQKSSDKVCASDLNLTDLGVYTFQMEE